MKTNKWLAIIFMFVFSTAACQNRYGKAADELRDRSPEPQNMNVGVQNYTTYIPDGWTTAKKSYGGIDYYFIAAPKTETDPNTNVNIITEKMQNLSLDAYKEGAIKSLKKAIPNAVIMDEGNIEAYNINGHWYSYAFEQSGIKASIVSYIIPKDGIAYIISGGTRPELADHYRSTFDSIARSFKFSEPLKVSK
jgi:hypothetical protein